MGSLLTCLCPLANDDNGHYIHGLPVKCLKGIFPTIAIDGLPVPFMINTGIYQAGWQMGAHDVLSAYQP